MKNTKPLIEVLKDMHGKDPRRLQSSHALCYWKNMWIFTFDGDKHDCSFFVNIIHIIQAQFFNCAI